MKKLLFSLFTVFMLLSLPVASFADSANPEESQQTSFSSRFFLVEEGIENNAADLKNLTTDEINTHAAGVGGFGTINCEAIGSGKMLCNWTVTLTRSGEAIQQGVLIFDVKNDSGKIVGQKDHYINPKGGNKPTEKGQIEFTPGKGTFSVEKYGSIEGRYAVYDIIAVTPSTIRVY
ncbi:hypothetical protein NYE48_10905 [Paenibacillus sp. FSL M7-1455]|uniref:DUF4352 domain-containing protein n=1 Tax=Paenibacillus cookii TaxID=157839 RepID=A0ABQ4LSE7_9BACL|nr:hypothetical protein [Paenibacillus cookii]KHF35236.1 hypothetical protein CM49_02577 [Paenibacillus sp. P1XP2]GIO66073.1 hypothetical protein J21TS3_08940 [Paenibacillus cookii]